MFSVNYKTLLIATFVILIFSCGSKSDENKAFEAALKTPALAEINDSIRKFPKADTLYANRAKKLMSANQIEAAASDFKKAFTLNDNQVNTINYGASLIEVKQVDEAIKILTDGVQKYTSNTEIKATLAYAYENKQKYTEAITLYDAILKQDPEDFITMRLKANALGVSGNTAEAVVWLEKSHTMFPTLGTATELCSYYAQTNSPKTIAFIDETMRMDTEGKIKSDLLYDKGLYYANANQFDKAIEFYDQCIQANLQNTPAYIDKAGILVEQKKYDAALQTVTLGQKIDLRNPDLFYLEGQCLEAKNDKQGAIQAYKNALAIDKNFSIAAEALQKLSK